MHENKKQMKKQKSENANKKKYQALHMTSGVGEAKRPSQLPASLLTPSLNKRAARSPKPLQASHTRRTLSKIAGDRFDKHNEKQGMEVIL